jgi:hypothetical protein
MSSGWKADLPAPAVRLFRRKAGELMPTLVLKLIRTIRKITPGKRRNSVNYLPEPQFGILDLILRDPKSSPAMSLPKVLRDHGIEISMENDQQTHSWDEVIHNTFAGKLD